MEYQILKFNFTLTTINIIVRYLIPKIKQLFKKLLFLLFKLLHNYFQTHVKILKCAGLVLIFASLKMLQDFLFNTALKVKDKLVKYMLIIVLTEYHLLAIKNVKI